MSRFQNIPLPLPAGVTVSVAGSNIKVKGAKGELSLIAPAPVAVQVESNQVKVTVPDKTADGIKVGLVWRLIRNMMKGVVDGYEKTLELNGVGYRMALKGDVLNMQVGFAHDVDYKIPVGIAATIKQNRISIAGIDKQLVGQVADQIRAVKPAEPYKGKGFKYTDETVRRKAGKSGAK